MKNFKGKLTSSLLLCFALFSNACGKDEFDNHAKASSTLSSANASSFATKSEKEKWPNEFFQTVVSSAEESKMIDVWKMAIDKNLENPNRFGRISTTKVSSIFNLFLKVKSLLYILNFSFIIEIRARNSRPLT